MRTPPQRRPSPITPLILTVRAIKVVLDTDLARVYGVTTARLNQALKRNLRRFPKDFAFQLSKAEHRNLRSQFVISSGAHGGRRTLPWVFTEHGALMAASVLNTARSIDTSIYVVRAFLRLRDLATTHRELVSKLDELEHRVTGHDDELRVVLAALRQLVQPPSRPRRAIGFASGATTAAGSSRTLSARRKRSDR
jgi:hypothetical protein